MKQPRPLKDLGIDSRRTWLIAYDIRDPARLARLGRVAARTAFRLHYSLYAVDLSDAEAVRLGRRLATLIDASTDDLRLYPLPAELFGAWLGPDPVTASRDAFAFGSDAADIVLRLRRQNMNIKRS